MNLTIILSASKKGPLVEIYLSLEISEIETMIILTMNYNKSRHKELVILAQELLNQGKHIFLEKEFFELSKYNIAVEEQVFWTHRENFLLLMKKLINNKINFDEFETAFSLLYRKTTDEVQIFERDLEQIETFEPSTRLDRFASFITSIFRQFEEIEDEYSTEEEVKDFVNEVYLKFQNVEE